MRHPDFRVRGKIFATLAYPDSGWGMVKLTPHQQMLFVLAEPKIFEPVKGGWGRRGATLVRLRAAKKSSVRKALDAAWRNTAPKRLVAHATRPAIVIGSADTPHVSGLARRMQQSPRGRGA